MTDSNTGFQNIEQTEIAVLGGGCFWCTEAILQQLTGVLKVTSGYAGGHTDNPTYRQVATGRTGHAEVVKIEFDPGQISYRDLLTVFFASHDPTTVNQQGTDVGTQYRSIILTTTAQQGKEAIQYIQELNGLAGGDPVITEVKELQTFYEAEAEHKNFYERNLEQSYSQAIISPKLEKVRQQFANLISKKL